MKYLSIDDWSDLQAVWDYLVVRDALPDYVDAIVVGGAALVTDMAQYAAELYHQGFSKKIVVSGYSVKAVDMVESEAMLLKRVLLANDVAEADIIIDEEAANIGQNITHSAEMLRQHDIDPTKVILVHKPFMTRRFLATAEAQWPGVKPEFFVTSVDMSLRDYFRLHHQAYPDDPGRMIWSMLGEYKRIKSYPDQGFSSSQPFSNAAEKAYRNLVEKGFEAR